LISRGSGHGLDGRANAVSSNVETGYRRGRIHAAELHDHADRRLDLRVEAVRSVGISHPSAHVVDTASPEASRHGPFAGDEGSEPGGAMFVVTAVARDAQRRP